MTAPLPDARTELADLAGVPLGEIPGPVLDLAVRRVLPDPVVTVVPGGAFQSSL